MVNRYFSGLVVSVIDVVVVMFSVVMADFLFLAAVVVVLIVVIVVIVVVILAALFSHPVFAGFADKRGIRYRRKFSHAVNRAPFGIDVGPDRVAGFTAGWTPGSDVIDSPFSSDRSRKTLCAS